MRVLIKLTGVPEGEISPPEDRLLTPFPGEETEAHTAQALSEVAQVERR